MSPNPDPTGPTPLSVVRNRGVTAPAGFRASAMEAAADTDVALALLVNEGPDLAAAGLLSSGEQRTAPQLWTQQVVTTGRLRAVLVHTGVCSPGATADLSGASEAASADFGDTHQLAETVASTLSSWGSSTGAVEVAVCATGGSGHRAAGQVLVAGAEEAVRELAGGLVGGTDAAWAIAGPARVAQAALAHEAGWIVGGMVGGAGTAAAGTTCLLTCDAVADPTTLRDALAAATADRLPLPACTTVVLQASGASEVTASPQALSAVVGAIYDDLQAQVTEGDL
ncbi:hypothetical protein [Rhodococcus sp. X156]|uniref:hypothetical protein n=1 Tax=Rhodococcus sp. X156 TaxID=2499145 RepID=UPI000FD71BEB|nr:hypothetical protein [Rhodococcus sp. X156]